jgi:uncharacterized protein (TIRG00374 family)
MVGYFILVLSPKLHFLIIKIISWILFKTKKIENRKEYEEEQLIRMSIIRKEISEYFKNLKHFFQILIIYIFKNLLFGSLPYIIYLLVSNDVFQLDAWFYTIIIGSLISYITNIVPIPGASGTAEVVFVAAFSLIYPNVLLNSIMLVWRFFSYFLNILVGFVTFIFVCAKKKSKRI